MPRWHPNMIRTGHKVYPAHDIVPSMMLETIYNDPDSESEACKELVITIVLLQKYERPS